MAIPQPSWLCLVVLISCALPIIISGTMFRSPDNTETKSSAIGNYPSIALVVCCIIWAMILATLGIAILRSMYPTQVEEHDPEPPALQAPEEPMIPDERELEPPALPAPEEPMVEENDPEHPALLAPEEPVVLDEGELEPPALPEPEQPMYRGRFSYMKIHLKNSYNDKYVRKKKKLKWTDVPGVSLQSKRAYLGNAP